MLNSCTPSRIGGSIPIVFSYFSEFLAQEKRGEHLSWLCMFWMIGGIYASAMAWAIIPHYGKSLPGTAGLSPRFTSASIPIPFLSHKCWFENNTVIFMKTVLVAV